MHTRKFAGTRTDMHAYKCTHKQVYTHTYKQVDTCTQTLVLKGIIGYLDYSFKIVIFESFKANRIFFSF